MISDKKSMLEARLKSVFSYSFYLSDSQMYLNKNHWY